MVAAKQKEKKKSPSSKPKAKKKSSDSSPKSYDRVDDCYFSDNGDKHRQCNKELSAVTRSELQGSLAPPL